MVAASLGGEARAEGTEPEAQVIPNYQREDPTLRSNFQGTAPCPSTGIVAFSVTGGPHISQGGYTLLGYEGTYTNLGGGWVPGGGSFIAPCTGLYSFTVSFVKDPYYDGATLNDVYVSVMHNGVSKGYAWAGATTTTARETGTYTVAVFMNAGDYVQTYVSSDGGAKRRIGRFNLTGYLVKSAY
jgi:hypothetical protein